MAPKKDKLFVDETEEELLSYTRHEVTYNMSELETAFCEHYVKNYNVKTAAVKAGYDKNKSSLIGYKIRRKPDVVRYIAWLKARVSVKCQLTAVDLIEKYMRIAFSDITDFIVIKGNRLRLKDGEEIDGQLVKSVKQGKDGVSIELYDKLHALDKLEKYFDCMPGDWKRKIEERKLQLIEERLLFDKARAGMMEEEEEAESGFIEALRETTNSVWNEE